MSTVQQSVALESWRRTLLKIPTAIGRLAYLASLRDPNTGSYQHVGLAQRIGEGEADRILRQSHGETFNEWLSFGLERQKEELENYFTGLDGDCREILANWLTLEPCAGWAPAESRDVERDLFHSDMKLVLELIRTEYGVASRDPDS